MNTDKIKIASDPSTASAILATLSKEATAPFAQLLPETRQPLLTYCPASLLTSATTFARGFRPFTLRSLGMDQSTSVPAAIATPNQSK